MRRMRSATRSRFAGAMSAACRRIHSPSPNAMNSGELHWGKRWGCTRGWMHSIGRSGGPLGGPAPLHYDCSAEREWILCPQQYFSCFTYGLATYLSQDFVSFICESCMVSADPARELLKTFSSKPCDQ